MADDKCLGSPREFLFSPAATLAGIYLPRSKHWPALPLPVKAVTLQNQENSMVFQRWLQHKSDKLEGALRSLPPGLVWGLASLERLVKTQLNSASYEDGRCSFNKTVDPLTKKPLSLKSISSTWRSLTHGILINARRVLRVTVFFICLQYATASSAQLEQMGKLRQTQQVTNTKTTERANVTAAPSPVFRKCFPSKRGKQNSYQGLWCECRPNHETTACFKA